ncbi:MAG: acetyltransferase [Akkermansiaceae bacterium]|nr:acetyltransferase [Akkermansiaceae bacterium]
MSFLCRLAPFQPSDATALARIFTEPQVREYLGGPMDAQPAAERAQGMIDEKLPTIWAIRPADPAAPEQPLLGVIWLRPHHGGADVEISYALLPEHLGRGYATEAVTAGLQHAFHGLGLTRVVAETQTLNERSVRLLERVGMSFERELERFGARQSLYVATPDGPNVSL